MTIIFLSLALRAPDPLYDPCRHTRIKRVVFDGNGDPVINLSDSAELADCYKTVTAKVIVG